MGDLFGGYQSEFNEFANDAAQLIATMPGLSGDELRNRDSEISGLLQEMGNTVRSTLITNMNVAIPSLTNKQAGQVVVDKCKTTLTELNAKFVSARKTTQGKADRVLLLGDESLASMKNRTEMLSGTEKLQQGQNELVHIVQLTSDIKQTGAETLVELDLHGERIQSQRDRMASIRAKMKDAGRLISAISSRMTMNDILKVCIMFVLIILTCVVIYIRWIRRYTTVAPSPPVLAPPPINDTLGPIPPIEGKRDYLP